MKRIFMIIWMLAFLSSSAVENYLIKGGQDSRIQYRLTQRVEPAGKTKFLRLSFVVPESFQSPTYIQKIENFHLDLTPKPSNRKEERDKRGNQIIRVTWNDPQQPVDVTMSFTAITKTVLHPIESNAAFPLTDIPKNMEDYLLIGSL